MSQERDTHFQNFAKLLWDELMSVTDSYIDVSGDGMDDEWIEKYKAIIAKRAYDLVWHTLHAVGLDDDSIPFQDVYRPEEDIPDMDKWPE